MIATVAPLPYGEPALENEYLLSANRTLKAKISVRNRFTGEEHRPLTRMSTALWRQATEPLSDDPSGSIP